MRYHLNILGGALKQAMRLEYVSRNVAQVVDRPRVERPMVKTMAREDVPLFLEAAGTSPYYRLFYTSRWSRHSTSTVASAR